MSRERQARPFIPLNARLLIGAAAVDVAVQMLSRGLLDGYFIWSPGVLVGVFSNASSFLLAAALIIGADGWPAGRPWLLAGAGLFVVAGFLNLGFWVWSWVESRGTGIYPDSVDLIAWWLNARALAEIGILSAGSLLVAMGLWKARPPRDLGQPPRRALLLGVTVLGVASASGYVAIGILVAALQTQATPLEYPFLAVQVATMTAISLAAISVLPRIGWLPEMTIAIGASVNVVAKGALASLFFTAASGSQSWMSSVYSGISAIEFAGFLLLTGGLAMGRFVAPLGARARANPSPP